MINLAEQLDKYQLFRRLIVVFGCGLVLYVTVRSFDLMAMAIVEHTPLLELAGVLASSHVPSLTAFAFISKLYWSKR